MPVPEALSTSEAWTVEMRHDRRGVRYRFGPYRVANVRWHDVRQRGGVVDAIKGKREYQERYEFALRDSTEGSATTRVECDSRDRDRGFSIGSMDIELESGLSLDCRVFLGADSAALAATLTLASRNDNVPRGTIERGEVKYEISGERERGDDDEELPRAYLVRRGETLVGMVDRTHPGIIRVSPSLPPADQDLVAAALMALLLQRKLIES
ncbi:MAG TPA: hypothetical protein VEY93_05315 [Longimicrobium sp.]|nr:hypothetical protein [Longimicrobium sp.]